MSSDRIWLFSEDVNVLCSECGKETTLNPDFDEVAGDLRLNFVKVRSTIPDSGTCPQCGNDMEVDVTYWRREFYCRIRTARKSAGISIFGSRTIRPGVPPRDWNRCTKPLPWTIPTTSSLILPAPRNL